MFGIGSLAGLIDPKTKKMKGDIWGLIAVSVGTMSAGLTGCSPIIVHLESFAGVGEGGRTGLTACVIAICFAICLFLSPLFGSIPAFLLCSVS